MANVPVETRRPLGLDPAGIFHHYMPGEPPREGCWAWTGPCNDAGYGEVRTTTTHMRAHRISYELFIGSIPEGLILRHVCDNPPCVQPLHLIPGTQLDNVQDSIDRGHKVDPPRMVGSQHARTQLAESDVLRIREMYATGQWTQRELGIAYGVSAAAIGLIVRRKTWTHI